MRLRLRLVKRFAAWLARRGRCWELRGPDGVYLRRYVIWGQTPEPDSPPAHSLYLHNIKSRDPDKGALHVHPWKWSFGIPLVNGYKERRLLTGPWGGEEITRWVTRGINWISEGDAHEVVAVLPDTWTLFATAPERPGSWGFIIPGVGYMQWKQAKDAGLIKTSEWVRVDEDGDPLPP